MNHLRGVGPVPTPLGNIHCMLINPPKIVSGARKQVHVTEWEGTLRNCGGDREFWLWTLPVSCRLEICAGRWSLQLALCCCQRNEHVRLSLPGWDPTQIMTQSNWVCHFYFFFSWLWGIETSQLVFGCLYSESFTVLISCWGTILNIVTSFLSH